MYFSKVLWVIFMTMKLVTSSSSCDKVTHSECIDGDSHIFLEQDVANKEACQQICTIIGEKCHFSLFDKNAYIRGNCRLYDIAFSKFILGCKEMSGPRELRDGCDLINPLDNTCHVYRRGKCDFILAEETEKMSSWESCHLFCLSNSQCELWRFEKEEELCLLYNTENSCSWEFSPRTPSFEECDIFCDIPEPQEHGNWFCPPSSDPSSFMCHLECNPGYVPDNGSVSTCINGKWSSATKCVAAIALITGNYWGKSVELYGEDIHTKMLDLPGDRAFHTLDLVDTSILLCGGYFTLTSCLVLSPSQEWVPHSITTSPRKMHTSMAALGQLHLLGGENVESILSTTSTELLTRSSTEWSENWDLFEANFGACTAKVDRDLAVTTGGDSALSSVVSYNVTSGKATRLQNLISSTKRHGCCTVMDVQTGFKGVLVAGGIGYHTDDSILSQLYDMKTGEWTSTGRLTTTRSNGVRLFVIGEQILAAGGHDYTIALSTVDRFNMTSRTWEAAESMLEPRWYFAVTGVPPSAVGIGQL